MEVKIFIIVLTLVNFAKGDVSCGDVSIESFKKYYIPDMEGTKKGDMGKILVVGGSTEYSGAPYFSAMSSLKAGADLIFVLTTETASPIIKSYSPELIVYPYLTNHADRVQIPKILEKVDVVIIGPGLGKSNTALDAFRFIIKTCRDLKKPLVIDADGLYFISLVKDEFRNYPGAILTPNKREVAYLKNGTEGYDCLGAEVSVLEKGKEDRFYFGGAVTWELTTGGSLRRAAGQGDILSGILGTFYSWALKSDCKATQQFAQSIAANVAAKLTRKCNELAFAVYGRSMTAVDMIGEIHQAFKAFFE